MSNSTHRVEVFRVEHIAKHPNADKLDIIRVFDNYQAVIRKDDFKVGDLACYVPPDNIMPDAPQYAFLRGHNRIRATKLRGVMSQGLVLPAPPGANPGDDVAELLGITHYVPAPNSNKGAVDEQMSIDPARPGEKYDVDSWFRYGSLIPDGTIVEITEKIHGANTRASYQNGKFWMGSHYHYWIETDTGLYWRVFHENPWLKKLCKQNTDCIVYGETYGNVQSLKYGAKGNEIFFRVFDIMYPNGAYMPLFEKMMAIGKAMKPTKWERFVNKSLTLLAYIGNVEKPLSLKTDNWTSHYVPILYIGEYNKELIEKYMSGPSQVPGANHLREGCVIKPVDELWDAHIGRLILKAVSPLYLAGSDLPDKETTSPDQK